MLKTWLNLLSCLVSSNNPISVRIVFWSCVIVGSSLVSKDALGTDNQGNP